MTIRYEMERYRFEHDPALERRIRELAEPATGRIQDIADACTREGFDPRSVAILLMEKALQPAIATDRVGGTTVVELVRR